MVHVGAIAGVIRAFKHSTPWEDDISHIESDFNLPQTYTSILSELVLVTSYLHCRQA